eukprot:4781224-Ditylum_brightwellii.AAC.1
MVVVVYKICGLTVEVGHLHVNAVQFVVMCYLIVKKLLMITTHEHNGTMERQNFMRHFSIDVAQQHKEN